MLLKSIEYIGPSIILIIIFILKLTVDETFSIEHLKRLFVETTIDIMSLAISFTVSFLIAVATAVNGADDKSLLWEMFGVGFLAFIGFILILVVIVFISKLCVRKYSEKEEIKYIWIGILVGYPISFVCLIISINLLRGLGGA